MRIVNEKSGVAILTGEVRKLTILYSRYLRKYFPNVMKSEAITENSVPVMEMSSDRFKELKYRTRLTPNEASAFYEMKAAERLKEQSNAS